MTSHEQDITPDLVRSKKTQRDKDWPMIRRLIESDYANIDNPSVEKIKFWLLESRTPNMLVRLVEKHVQLSAELAPTRPLLEVARAGNMSVVEDELEKEQKLERDADRAYWTPLFQELERLRHEGHDTEEEV